MKAAERLKILMDTMRDAPKPPGFSAFDWNGNAAMKALRAMVDEADAEATKASKDPMLPEGGRLFRVGQIKSELAGKIGKWREEHLGALDERIRSTIPTPPTPNVSPAYAAQLLHDFDGVDPTQAELLYLSNELPPDVARIIESAPARIIGKIGEVPHVRLRVSEAARARRHYLDAPPEARERHDGLSAIRSGLHGAASIVEASLKDE